MPDEDLPVGVLIDMDGTLAQTEVHWGVAERALMRDLGSHWTDADQARALGGPLKRVVAYMIGKTGGEHDHAEITERLLAEVATLLRSDPPEWSAGMLELLDECANRNIPTALVTASDGSLAAIVVEQLTERLQRIPFAAVVSADDVERGKPAPDPYLLAASRLQVDPKGCLALEDSPTGVRSAVDAGCRVIAIEHMTPIENPHAVVVDSIEGLGVGALWGLFGSDRAENR
jgi:beta-phosphoglucomutase-like phosphatase (HAD superfamily)